MRNRYHRLAGTGLSLPGGGRPRHPRPRSYKCRICGQPKLRHKCTGVATGDSQLELDSTTRPVERNIPEHWSAEEDAAIAKLRGELGGNRWNQIAEQIPGRSDQAVRMRWYIG